MRTTVTFSESTLRAAKKRALAEAASLSEVVERAVRLYLAKPERSPRYKFVPLIKGGKLPNVDIADRDALYDLMDARK
jgi:hypothetical protein